MIQLAFAIGIGRRIANVRLVHIALAAAAKWRRIICISYRVVAATANLSAASAKGAFLRRFRTPRGNCSLRRRLCTDHRSGLRR